MYLEFMNKILLIIVLLLISNCTLNKVIKHHGVHFLEKKQEKLLLNSSNKNDITKLLGPPSVKSTFDSDMWIYIERDTSSSKISKLGKKKLLKNNVLILELDSKGLLVKKLFLNKDDMKNIKFTDSITEMSFKKRTFLYNFLSGLRQKINDPLGKKKIKN